MNIKKPLAGLFLATAILSTSATSVFAVTDAEMAKAQEQSKSATSEIEQYQNKVDRLETERKQAANKKTKLENDAKLLDQETKTLNEVIKSRESNLNAQARSAQINSNSGRVVDTLLDSDSIVDAIQRVSAIVTVTGANANMLKAQREDKAALETKSKKLQQNYSDYIKLEERLAQSSKEAATAKAQLEVAQLDYKATIAKGESERATILAQKAKAEQAVKVAKANETQAIDNQAKVNEQREASSTTTENAIENETSVTTPSQSSPETGSQTSPTPPSPSIPDNSGNNNNSNSDNSGNSNETPQPPVQTGSVWDYRHLFMTSSSSYNGYAGGGCTDYVWQWFAQRGVYIPNVMPGNGKDWAYQMPRAPKVVPGVIASFAGGAHGSSPVYGHVAIVESVNADGSFVVSEGGVGAWGSTRTIPNQSGVTFVLP